MKIVRRLIAGGCVGLMMWLYVSHLGEEATALAGLKDNIMQGATEGAKESLKERINKRIHAGPDIHGGSATGGSHSQEPVQAQPTPGVSLPSTETAHPSGGSNGETNGVAVVQEGQPTDPPDYAYRGDGRRDPFMAIVQDSNKAVETNLNIPPLQRVNLSEISLIGIVTGGFGYIAMVQTPDGRGYTVREGTRIGSGDGLVSVINAEALTVKEPFIDIFGKKEMREHVISLHPKVNVE